MSVSNDAPVVFASPVTPLDASCSVMPAVDGPSAAPKRASSRKTNSSVMKAASIGADRASPVISDLIAAAISNSFTISKSSPALTEPCYFVADVSPELLTKTRLLISI